MDFPTSIDRTSLFQVLGVLSGIFFYFYSNSNRITCNQTVETLIRRHVLRRQSDLGLYCLPMSHKKDARLIWVKNN